MPKPKGRPREFTDRIDIPVDGETKAWLSAVAAATGASEATVVRSILKTCRDWASRYSETDSQAPKEVQVAP